MDKPATENIKFVLSNLQNPNYTNVIFDPELLSQAIDEGNAEFVRLALQKGNLKEDFLISVFLSFLPNKKQTDKIFTRIFLEHAKINFANLKSKILYTLSPSNEILAIFINNYIVNDNLATNLMSDEVLRYIHYIGQAIKKHNPITHFELAIAILDEYINLNRDRARYASILRSNIWVSAGAIQPETPRTIGIINKRVSDTLKDISRDSHDHSYVFFAMVAPYIEHLDTTFKLLCEFLKSGAFTALVLEIRDQYCMKNNINLEDLDTINTQFSDPRLLNPTPKKWNNLPLQLSEWSNKGQSFSSQTIINRILAFPLNFSPSIKANIILQIFSSDREIWNKQCIYGFPIDVLSFLLLNCHSNPEWHFLHSFLMQRFIDKFETKFNTYNLLDQKRSIIIFLENYQYVSQPPNFSLAMQERIYGQIFSIDKNFVQSEVEDTDEKPFVTTRLEFFQQACSLRSNRTQLINLINRTEPRLIGNNGSILTFVVDMKSYELVKTCLLNNVYPDALLQQIFEKMLAYNDCKTLRIFLKSSPKHFFSPLIKIKSGYSHELISILLVNHLKFSVKKFAEVISTPNFTNYLKTPRNNNFTALYNLLSTELIVSAYLRVVDDILDIRSLKFQGSWEKIADKILESYLGGYARHQSYHASELRDFLNKSPQPKIEDFRVQLLGKLDQMIQNGKHTASFGAMCVFMASPIFELICNEHNFKQQKLFIPNVPARSGNIDSDEECVSQDNFSL